MQISTKFCQFLSISVNFCQFLQIFDSISYICYDAEELIYLCKQLKILARNSQAVMIYDNINFKNMKQNEIVSHKSNICLMITAAIIFCSELSFSDLHQIMHNSTMLFCIHNIFSALRISDDDDVELNISRSLIIDMIKKLHSFSINYIFTNNDNSYFKISSFQSIHVNKIWFWQFETIFENENTIDEIYNVHKNIFLKQLKL